MNSVFVIVIVACCLSPSLVSAQIPINGTCPDFTCCKDEIESLSAQNVSDQMTSEFSANFKNYFIFISCLDCGICTAQFLSSSKLIQNAQDSILHTYQIPFFTIRISVY